MTLVLEEMQAKELFKQAVTEVLQERRDLLYDVFAEVMEDFALAKAMKEWHVYSDSESRRGLSNTGGKLIESPIQKQLYQGFWTKSGINSCFFSVRACHRSCRAGFQLAAV